MSREKDAQERRLSYLRLVTLLVALTVAASGLLWLGAGTGVSLSLTEDIDWVAQGVKVELKNSGTVNSVTFGDRDIVADDRILFQYEGFEEANRNVTVEVAVKGRDDGDGVGWNTTETSGGVTETGWETLASSNITVSNRSGAVELNWSDVFSESIPVDITEHSEINLADFEADRAGDERRRELGVRISAEVPDEGVTDQKTATAPVVVSRVGVDVNFEPPDGSPRLRPGYETPEGFVPDTGDGFNLRYGLAYGWFEADTGAPLSQNEYRDRNASGVSKRNDTLNYFNDNTTGVKYDGERDYYWGIEIADGVYNVTVVGGDANNTNQEISYDIEDTRFVDGTFDNNTNQNSRNFVRHKGPVNSQGGLLTVTPLRETFNPKINWIKIRAFEGPFFDVSITGTNTPVEEGDLVKVNYTVENVGTEEDTQDIELDVENSLIDVEPNVNLQPGGTFNGTLEWNTSIGDGGTPEILVSSEDDNTARRKVIIASIPIAVNFRPPANRTPDGIKPIEVRDEFPEADVVLNDTGDVFAERDSGLFYGWNSTQNTRGRPRSPDQNRSNYGDYEERNSTFIHFIDEPSGADAYDISVDPIWGIELPNGVYDIEYAGGDSDFLDQNSSFRIEDTLFIDQTFDTGTNTSSRNFIRKEGTVEVDNEFMRVIPPDGTYNPKMSWITIDPDVNGSYYKVEITDAPLTAAVGETVTVEAEVTNVGDSAGMPQDAVFTVDGVEEGTVQDVTLMSGGSQNVSFTYTVGGGDEPSFDIRVSSDDNDATRTVIAGDPQAEFNITVDRAKTDDNVTAGQEATVVADVTNVGDGVGEQDVLISIENGTGEVYNETRRVRVGPGSTREVSFGYTTSMGDVPSINATVSGDNDSANVTVGVNATEFFDVSIDDGKTDSGVSVGDNATVVADVNNTGGEGTQDIELTVKNSTGDEVYNEAKQVTVPEGGSTEVSFEYPTDTDDVPEVDATVSSDDTSDTTTVNVSFAEGVGSLGYAVGNDLRVYDPIRDVEADPPDPGNVSVIGANVADLTDNGREDIPFLTDAGISVTRVGASTYSRIFDDTGFAPGIQDQKTRLAVGDWNASSLTGNLVLFADSNNDALYAVNGSGDTEQIADPGNGVVGVTDVVDIDSDGDDEMVFADGSQQLRYLEQNGTIVGLSNGGVGSDQSTGFGPTADFDGDGEPRIPFITGSNEVALIDSDNNKVTLTGGVAEKSAIGPTDMDGDGEVEIVFLGLSDGKIRYVDDVAGSNTVVGPVSVEGVEVTPNPAVGINTQPDVTPSSFNVSVNGTLTDSAVTAGDNLTVVADVNNTGSAGTQDVNLTLNDTDGNTVFTDSVNLTLGAGTEGSVTFEYGTDVTDTPELNATVTSRADSAETTVTVEDVGNYSFTLNNSRDSRVQVTGFGIRNTSDGSVVQLGDSLPNPKDGNVLYATNKPTLDRFALLPEGTTVPIDSTDPNNATVLNTTDSFSPFDLPSGDEVRFDLERFRNGTEAPVNMTGEDFVAEIEFNDSERVTFDVENKGDTVFLTGFNAQTGTFQISGTGTQQVSGLGFEPDVIDFKITSTNSAFDTDTSLSGEEWGWGHGYADCTGAGGCKEVALTVGSGSDSTNGMAAAATDSYSVFQAVTPKDGDGIDGWINATVTGTDSDGFDLSVDTAAQDQYVEYTAYDFENGANVSVGAFDTATSTGLDSVTTGFEPNFLRVDSQPNDGLSGLNDRVQEGSGDNGWSHGWAAENNGTIEQLSMSVSMHANNIDYHSWASSDSDVLYVLSNEDKNSNINGKIQASVDSFDANGFTLDYSSVDQGQPALYMAIGTEANADVGYTTTPTSTGTQTVSTDTRLEHVSLVSSNTIPDIDVESIISDNSADGHHGWMHGGGNVSAQTSLGFSSHSNSVNGHASGSRANEAFHLVYSDRGGGVIGTDTASITDISSGSFTLDWSSVTTTADGDVAHDDVLIGYYGFSTQEVNPSTPSSPSSPQTVVYNNDAAAYDINDGGGGPTEAVNFSITNNLSSTVTMTDMTVESPVADRLIEDSGSAPWDSEVRVDSNDVGRANEGNAYTLGDSIAAYEDDGTFENDLAAGETATVYMHRFRDSNGDQVDMDGEQVTVTFEFQNADSETFTFTPQRPTTEFTSLTADASFRGGSGNVQSVDFSGTVNNPDGNGGVRVRLLDNGGSEINGQNEDMSGNFGPINVGGNNNGDPTAVAELVDTDGNTYQRCEAEVTQGADPLSLSDFSCSLGGAQ